jgi:ubiquinone/menaquinone biosynthesis C-methylase UbiE
MSVETDAPTTNAEAIQAWDGPLFERFSQYRELVTTGLGNHGEAALALFPPQAGQRVLDIGCGFGDTTQRIAGMVGPEGEAVGVDAAPKFIEASRKDAAEAGVSNTRFETVDVQTGELGGPYDMAFSRMGVMFFANPVQALRNIRGALKPGARLVAVVWRIREDNDWMYRAQTIVEGIVSRPEEYDEPTCGPGPFSMANADTVTGQLKSAGFSDIELHRSDLPILIGHDLNEAIEVVMAIGPAGEILRLQGDRAAHLHGQVHSALEDGLAEYTGPDGVRAPASTWIVSAVA